MQPAIPQTYANIERKAQEPTAGAVPRREPWYCHRHFATNMRPGAQVGLATVAWAECAQA